MTMGGGGNNEFQWYVNDRANSFTLNGNLHLKPTYTSDIYGEEFLYTGKVVIPPEECTHEIWNGCQREGQGRDGPAACYIIPPIRSAKVTTWNSFSFKYGTMEIRAKNPAGDWLWPALWLMPRESVYGEWPRSGEIDVMESRGNRDLRAGDAQVGTQQTGATLHYGPIWYLNGWGYAHQTINNPAGYDTNFHNYKMVWTETALEFFIDNQRFASFAANDGFWYRGNFGDEFANIWPHNPMGPFDQEFFIQMNNAVGGTAFFQDAWYNGGGQKPWQNNDPCHHRSFWHGRSQWEPTWNMHNNDRDLVVDYVRVWAM